jgi:hypothetical protein
VLVFRDRGAERSHSWIKRTTMPNRPSDLASSHFTARVEVDNLGVSATFPDVERQATARAARAFREFWNTGDDTLLKRVFDENFADHKPPSR